MSELVFLKLGGSLLTDKTWPQALRGDVLAPSRRRDCRGPRRAPRAASGDRPRQRLVRPCDRTPIRHARRRTVASRVARLCRCGPVAAELNRLVVDALWAAGVPALRIQPSARRCCYDGELLALDDRPLIAALAHGLAPVVHGDVALDEVRGGTIISTEEIFGWLAPRLRPQRVVLVGEVPGVLTADPSSGIEGDVIAEITPATLPLLGEALGGSRGVDVTGGMVAKVAQMVTLVQITPSLACIQVITGLTPRLLQRVLVDPTARARHAHRGHLNKIVS